MHDDDGNIDDVAKKKKKRETTESERKNIPAHSFYSLPESSAYSPIPTDAHNNNDNHHESPRLLFVF